MKLLYRAFTCSLLAFIMVSTYNPGKACDRSSFILDSLVFDGTNYNVFATLCLGGGTLGGVNGANQFTSTFAIAFYGSSGVISGFTPPTLSADSTGCTFNGGLFPVPPVTPLLGGTGDAATSYVAYQPASGACNFLSCIGNSVDCGLPHTQCYPMSFVLTDIPDSLTAIGIEGQGNPANGCHQNFAPGYDDNITIDFTTLPVIWGGFMATAQEETVDLRWTTNNESNNDYFQVMRSADARNWEEIGQVDAVGDSQDPLNYDFTDENPMQGVNHYRIVQIDNNARFTETEVRTINFSAKFEMGWREVGPIPTRNKLSASFVVPESEILEIELFSIDGKKVMQESFDAESGRNTLNINLENFQEGIYFLRIKGSQGILERKLIKI